MVRAAAIISFLAAGCSQQASDQSFRDQGAADHIELVELKGRIDRQDNEISSLRNTVSATLNLAMATDRADEALRKTFNANVAQHNEELRRERTVRGVCGQEQVWAKDGTYTIRNKDCPAPAK